MGKQDKQMENYQAGELLQLARETIRREIRGEASFAEQPTIPVFSQEAACFVTLKVDGRLRGCIGNLEPVGTLWESVRKNALSAAFHDSRFTPLTAEELAHIHIDISILAKPRPLYYSDAADLITKLRPGIDGVILRHNNNGATFLPQVWQQLPTVEAFLDQLCKKAGLPENFWREDYPEILIYEVQCIAEEKT